MCCGRGLDAERRGSVSMETRVRGVSGRGGVSDWRDAGETVVNKVNSLMFPRGYIESRVRASGRAYPVGE